MAEEQPWQKNSGGRRTDVSEEMTAWAQLPDPWPESPVAALEAAGSWLAGVKLRLRGTDTCKDPERFAPALGTLPVGARLASTGDCAAWNPASSPSVSAVIAADSDQAAGADPEERHWRPFVRQRSGQALSPAERAALEQGLLRIAALLGDAAERLSAWQQSLADRGFAAGLYQAQGQPLEAWTASVKFLAKA